MNAFAERQQHILKAELLEVRDREAALHMIQSTLHDQVELLRTELSDCQNKIESDRLELSKTTVLNQTLQRKHKVYNLYHDIKHGELTLSITGHFESL